MRILIATAGALSPARVADLMDRWLGAAQHVTVLTVVEVPHPFLDTLETPIWRPLEADAGAEPPPDLAANYVEERGRKRTEPLASALASRGLPHEVIYREGEDPAEIIHEVADQIDADLIMLGATRPLFPDWDSVSVRVMQESRRPLLVIPGAPPTTEPDQEPGFVDELTH
ncbi:MAG: universal stress protein [Acidimicrobiia bacterium]